MNKRLKKKITSHHAGMTRKKLKEQNAHLVSRIATLTVDKLALIQKNFKLQANLDDCKAAHVVDYSEQVKEITLLKATNNDLSSMMLELNKSIRELHSDIRDLEIENMKLKNRNIFERVLNKGA